MERTFVKVTGTFSLEEIGEVSIKEKEGFLFIEGDLYAEVLVKVGDDEYEGFVEEEALDYIDPSTITGDYRIFDI